MTHWKKLVSFRLARHLLRTDCIDQFGANMELGIDRPNS